MAETSEFYGIRNSNLRSGELFSREMFPRSLTIALANYMGDRRIPLNYISADRSGGCRISGMEAQEMYGRSPQEMVDARFDFGSCFEPWQELVKGVPEQEFVLRDCRGAPVCCLDLKTSVVPDASTKDLPPDFQGPEMTLKTESLEGIALSIAQSLSGRSERALEILVDGIPEDVDWSDWDRVSGCVNTVICNLDLLESEFSDLQRPRMLQAVWRTETDGPFMTDNAMDAFVWSDFALTRLFLDGNRQFSDRRATRPLRSAVRLHLMLVSILSGERPSLGAIVDETDYGLGGRKEFMVNGKATNRVMYCDRLVDPAVSALDSTFLLSSGSERMIMPERSLEMSMYYAVRTLRR